MHLDLELLALVCFSMALAGFVLVMLRYRQGSTIRLWASMEWPAYNWRKGILRSQSF